MEDVTRLERPDRILHLGDLVRDAEALAEKFPQIPVSCVPGNCDGRRPDLPEERVFTLDGCRLLMTHGHIYHVKMGMGLAVRAARDKLSAALGREPTLSELGAETGLEPEEIAAAEEAGLPVASLQMEMGEGLTLESVLGTEGIEEGIVERESLRTAIAALPDRERQVILLRYYRGMTQDRTARVLGVSQVQISRIERRAMERLRHKLEE